MGVKGSIPWNKGNKSKVQYGQDYIILEYYRRKSEIQQLSSLMEEGKRQDLVQSLYDKCWIHLNLLSKFEIEKTEIYGGVRAINRRMARNYASTAWHFCMLAIDACLDEPVIPSELYHTYGYLKTYLVKYNMNTLLKIML